MPKIIFEQNDLEFTFKVSGALDESTDLSHYPLNNAKVIHIFFESIGCVNSFGIREWLKWMLTAKDKKVLFYQCPRPIIEQINMSFNFLPLTGKVLSLYVPYYNEQTNKEKNILLEYGKDFTESDLNLPEVKDESGNEMELDIIPKKYFAFLNRK